MGILKRLSSGVNDDDVEPMTTREGKALRAMPARSRA